jgi:hypothetical protein
LTREDVIAYGMQIARDLAYREPVQTSPTPPPSRPAGAAETVWHVVVAAPRRDPIAATLDEAASGLASEGFIPLRSCWARRGRRLTRWMTARTLATTTSRLIEVPEALRRYAAERWGPPKPDRLASLQNAVQRQQGGANRLLIAAFHEQLPCLGAAYNRLGPIGEQRAQRQARITLRFIQPQGDTPQVGRLRQPDTAFRIPDHRRDVRCQTDSRTTPLCGGGTVAPLAQKAQSPAPLC